MGWCGSFLIGDVPALTVRADRTGVGVPGGIALAEAHPVFLPSAHDTPLLSGGLTRSFT